MEDLFPNTEPTKVGIVKSLTRDTTVQACIFDLVDNAIDAAQDAILSKNERTLDNNGIPSDFSGYEITISIGNEGVSVSDNCNGIPSEVLEEDSLRFGSPSSKKFGIGLFGVGLNRAIFKIGGVGFLETCTSNERSLVELDVQKYLDDEDGWKVIASKEEYSGEIGTSIKITKPNEHALHFLGRRKNIEQLIEVASEMYAYFLEKGLVIIINGDPLSPQKVLLREDSPFPMIVDEKIVGDVKIQIEAGQHAKHRFSAEPKIPGHSNKGLSGDYGWNVVCNDRPIVLRNKEEKTGWDVIWHNEYNGFVGFVRFYSHDGEALPWNTPKTDLVVTHEAYQHALDMMDDATEKWRNYTRVAKSYKKRRDKLLPLQETGENDPIWDEIEKGDKDKDKNELVDPDPHPIRPRKDWMVLPNNIDASRCQLKLQSLVYEAQITPINKKRYTALALMRMLFEVAAQDYLIDLKLTSRLKKKIVADRNATRQKRGEGKLSQDTIKEIEPKLSDLLKYFKENPEIWGENTSSFMRPSILDFLKHKKVMESAIHKPRQRIAQGKVEDIRDEILPILKHLIERPDKVVLDADDEVD